MFGATWTSEGVLGGSYQFDGTNDFIVVNEFRDFGQQLVTNFAISAWAKSTIGDRHITIFGVNNAGINTFVWFYLNNRDGGSGVEDGGATLRLRDEDGNPSTYVADTNDVDATDGSWHLITSVRDEDRLLLYVDGVPVDDIDVSHIDNTLNFEVDPTVGARNNVGTIDRQFDGMIDDLRIYQCPLSAADVLALYNAGSTTSTTSTSSTSTTTTSTTSTTSTTGALAFAKADFDGDAVSDLAVFNSSESKWYIRSIATNPPTIANGLDWGFPGVVPLWGDYDGDLIADLAVFDVATSAWFIRKVSGPGIVSDFQWGFDGVIPLSGDYDGDGVFDPAVFDPATGDWYIRSLVAMPDTILNGLNWGSPGMIPLPGDYDCDGISDLCVYDPAKSEWHIRSVTNPATVIASAIQWGGPGMIPVPGDYDCDGKWDLALYDPATSLWWIRSIDAMPPTIAGGVPWGFPGVIPVPGDFDGDGKCDLAVYHRATGDWYIRRIAPGPAIEFGLNWGGGPGVLPVYPIGAPLVAPLLLLGP